MTHEEAKARVNEMSVEIAKVADSMQEFCAQAASDGDPELQAMGMHCSGGLHATLGSCLDITTALKMREAMA